MKKKIAYISSEWFADTDLTVLSQLAVEYNVNWFYLITDINKPRFDIDEIINYSKERGINLIVIDTRHRKRLDPKGIKTCIRIAKLILEIKVDIIYKVAEGYWWQIAYFLYLRHIPIVYGLHDCIVHSGAKHRWIFQKQVDLVVRTNNNFIFFSEQQRQIFEERYGKGKNCTVVGMSVKDFGKSSVAPPLVKDGIKLLFFGQIHSYKGLDLLIEALEKAYSCGVNNIELSIYGKGDYWNSCKKLIKHSKIFNLHIRFINNDEIPGIFASHHFLVLPYRDATQSGPIMIAANYGLPIFSTDLSSFRSVYDNSNSIMFDINELLSSLISLSKIEQYHYNQLKTNATNLKNRFGEKVIAKNYISFFNSLLQKHNTDN